MPIDHDHRTHTHIHNSNLMRIDCVGLIHFDRRTFLLCPNKDVITRVIFTRLIDAHATRDLISRFGIAEISYFRIRAFFLLANKLIDGIFLRCGYVRVLCVVSTTGFRDETLSRPDKFLRSLHHISITIKSRFYFFVNLFHFEIEKKTTWLWTRENCLRKTRSSRSENVDAVSTRCAIWNI